MPSPRALLITTLLTILQFTLSDAKGGGKGSTSKGSKKSKSKTAPKPQLLEEEKCYNAQNVQIPCPGKNNTGLIIGMAVGVVAAVLILALAIWYFKRRSHKKNKKSLSAKSRGLDDGLSDRESIVPLVWDLGRSSGGTTTLYYADKSARM